MNIHYFAVMIMVTLALFHSFAFAQGNPLEGASVRTESGGLTSRVAPGELLPVSIKLLNFGGGKKVDVVVLYEIIDAEEQVVHKIKETVAVETTASFVKMIQIPFELAPGQYTARSSIAYKDQLVPATTQFPFIVERKIAGMFVSQLMIYGAITTVIGAMFAVGSRLVIKKRRTGRFSALDYSDKPYRERIYYEIISDAIQQMRLRVGDDALEIAKSVPDLEIDTSGGKVLSIKRDPSKIIALLVLRYDTILGKRVSFEFRDRQNARGDDLEPIEKNIEVVRKYFE